MTSKNSQHNKVVKAVEKEIRRFTRDILQGVLLDDCLRLWRDFADKTDLGRTRKPETWAAALFYTFDRIQFGDISQEQVAGVFRVSAISVSQKYRQMSQTLSLVLLDKRYLHEARRMVVLREFGTLPENLPLDEVSNAYWHMPLEFRTEDPLHEAQDLVYDGWESMGDDPEVARLYFEEALDRDPYLADAHNGLANVVAGIEDWVAAEAHYKKAYEMASVALGSESPNAYYWWGELETRPYMRARQGLGWVRWQMGRYAEAIADYEALLLLNPNDNQGMRYVIAPLYQLAGDLEGAMAAYARYHKNYPDDMGDPHFAFCEGLALFNSNRFEDAITCWMRAIFKNIYISPLLLGEAIPDIEVWHGTNLAWLEYGEEYPSLYGTLWEEAPSARKMLRRLWGEKSIQEDVKQWLHIGHELQKLSGKFDLNDEEAHAIWGTLISDQLAIEKKEVSKEVLRRILVAD